MIRAATVFAASLCLPLPAAAQDGHAVFGDAPAPVALNGQLALGGLSGGVGNTYGTYCCTGGSAVVAFGVPRRQGLDGDIAFRAARDVAFANPFSGPATDRAFRFRGNAIQRSGF